MIALSSSLIHSAGYDEQNKILFIRFLKNHTLYCYFNVPKNIFNELISTANVGSFFTKNIRKVYGYQKIE